MEDIRKVLSVFRNLRFNGFPRVWVRRNPPSEATERDCGYQCPWNPLHGSCIAYVVAAILVHFGLISPNFNNFVEVIAVKLLTVLFTFVIVSALVVSLIDPKHYLLRFRIPLHTQIDIDPARYLCQKCKLLREKEEVKHCNHCGKCVDGFDHHCFALNHCVGERNYWVMMVLFNNGLLLTIALLATAILFLYGVFARSRIMRPPFANSVEPLVNSQLLCFGSNCTALLLVVVIGIYIIPTLIVLLSFGALVGAHWSLVAENSTTWQHFRRRREANKGESAIMRCLMCNMFGCLHRGKKKPETTTDRQTSTANADRRTTDTAEKRRNVSKENLLENEETQGD